MRLVDTPRGSMQVHCVNAQSGEKPQGRNSMARFVMTRTKASLVIHAALIAAVGAMGCAKKSSTADPEPEVADDSGGGGGGGGGSTSSVTPDAQAVIAALVAAIGPSTALLGADDQLTADQADQVGNAAERAVLSAGHGSSSDYTEIMGDIMGGAEGSLDTVGVTDPDQVTGLSGKMAGSLFKSLSEADDENLPDDAAAEGQTAKGTAIAAIGQAAMANLTAAGVPDADVPETSEAMSSAIVARVGAAGSGEDDIIEGELPALSAGLTAGISTLPPTSISADAALSAVSTGSTKGLASLATKLPSSGSAERALTGITAAMTQQLSKFSTDAQLLPDLAAKISSGATAGLGPVVTAFSMSTTAQTDLVAATTAGPTQALPTLASKVPAMATSDRLAAMLDKITAAPASGLSKAGFPASQVPDLLSGMAYGASANLGVLTAISGISQTNTSAFLGKISQSANAAVAAVDVPSFAPSTNLVKTITTKVSTQATAAINRIAAADPNFSSSHAKDGLLAISNGATAGLGSLAQLNKISGGDLGAIALEASKGVMTSLGSLNVPGMSSLSTSTIANDLKSTMTSAFNNMNSISGFNPSTAGTQLNQDWSQLQSSTFSQVSIPTFDITAMKTECTNKKGTWDNARNLCVFASYPSMTM